MFCFKCKINESVNKFLLAGDTFTSEVYLKQSGFAYSACGPFTKTKKEWKSLYRQNTDFIYK